MANHNRSTLASAFVIITTVFPRLGRHLWRRWYNFLATNDNHHLLQFMNYGYDGLVKKKLDSINETNRLQIQLYEHVIDDIELKGKVLLEVGSGRGGGLNHLASTRNLASVTGVDISDQAIKQCAIDYPASGITFLQGSADNLPVDSCSVDVVINVESSHCYPDMTRFLKEVFRVLKPGGFLAICDIRTQKSMDQLEKDFDDCGYKVVRENTITNQILSALEKMSDNRIKIADSMPALIKKAFTDFAGVQSSAAYDMMKNKKLVYKSFLLVK